MRNLSIGWLVIAMAVIACPLPAAEHIYPEIDRQIEAKAGGPLAAPADDARFARRVFLDLAGRIPTSEELRAFLSDTSAEKRERLVDRLLHSEDHVRRMTDFWHVMLMERLGDHDDWRRFLRDSTARNKSWNQMAAEMICAPAEDESSRGAAFFISKRLENYGQNPVDYPALVRDVGRTFLGIDVQCAQCHDHLFVDDYKQDYFQGLYAFLAQTTIRQDVTFPAVAENLVTKKVAFKSVFGGDERQMGPKLPGGEEIVVPEFPKGEEYVTPPDKKTRFPGVLKFSPLKILAEQLPRPDRRAFSRNAVNRLWWMMMGRGLVHPLDLHHSANPPSHPELLESLAGAFEAHGGDIRWMLRELALSQTYQRSSEMQNARDVPPASYRFALEKPLSAEQLLWSTLVATGELDRLAQAGLVPDLKPARDRFVAAFANPPRDPEVEFSPSVRAALFLMNDSTVLGWLKPAAGNRVDRAAKLTDNGAAVEELYLGVLARLPTPDEKTEAVQYLASKTENRPLAIGHLAWSLIASTEFSVNP